MNKAKKNGFGITNRRTQVVRPGGHVLGRSLVSRNFPAIEVSSTIKRASPINSVQTAEKPSITLEEIIENIQSKFSDIFISLYLKATDPEIYFIVILNENTLDNRTQFYKFKESAMNDFKISINFKFINPSLEEKIKAKKIY